MALKWISCNNEGMFACSTQDGVRIFNMDPLHEIKKIDGSIIGSVAICEMLDSSNILAIVGLSGKQQRFAENAVLLWDDFAETLVAEFTFASNVLAVKMRKDRLFVTEKNSIHAFVIPDDPTKLFTISTGPNPKGLMEINPCCSSEQQLLVCPGLFTGKIQIIDLGKFSTDSACTTYTLPTVIQAHKNEIASLAINNQGTLVATGSTRGTLIRVFDTQKKVLLIELRRGSGGASLQCINFSGSSEFLCASSANGTVHIFAVKQPKLNKKLPLSGITGWLSSYTDSSWAFATFKVPEDRKCVCVFSGDSTIYAISTDGTLYKYICNSEGECRRESFNQFLDLSQLQNDKVWESI